VTTVPRLASIGAAAVIALTCLTFAWLAPAQAQTETVRLRVGASTVVPLSENPSTGYRWRLDTAASRNLAIVTVADAGFAPPDTGGRPLVGAPGQRRFRITARSPGTAVAAFAYARPWERGAPARRHVIAIEIAR
jgi:inhibitor of cysteine peptidase